MKISVSLSQSFCRSQNHHRALVGGVVLQAVAFQHIEIGGIREVAAVPVVMIVLGMVDDAAPTVEYRQFRRLIIAVQRFVVLIFIFRVTASNTVASRARSVVPVFERNDEIVIGPIAIWRKHIGDLEFHWIHPDVPEIRGVATLGVVDLQLCGVVTHVHIGETRLLRCRGDVVLTVENPIEIADVKRVGREVLKRIGDVRVLQVARIDLIAVGVEDSEGKPCHQGQS